MIPNKIYALFAAFLLVLAVPFVAAQEVEVDGEVRIQADAGIGPNNFLYGLENAFERVRLSLTTNPHAKAQRALNLADERIAEYEEMVKRGDLRAADRARERYERYVELAAESAQDIESDESAENAQEAISQSADIRAKMQLRLDHLDEVYERVISNQATNLSEEQIANITQAFERASQRAEEADMRVEEKREQAKTRLRVLANLSEQEAEMRAENLSAQLYERIELRTERLVNRFEDKLTALENDTSNRSEVARQRLRAVFEQKINRTRTKFEIRDEQLRNRLDVAVRMRPNELRREFREQGDGIEIERRERIRDDGRVEIRERIREDNSGSNDLDIEAEVYENSTVVDIRIDGVRESFTLDTTDQQAIRSEIASRYNLSDLQVNVLVEFDYEDDAREESSDEDSDADGVDDDSQQEAELEVEVDVYADYAIVEYELGSDFGELRIDATSQDEIIRFVAAQLDVSAERVSAVAEFSRETQESEDEEVEDEREEADDSDDDDVTVNASARLEA